MNQVEENNFKQRVRNAFTWLTNSPGIYADVVKYDKLGECIPDATKDCNPHLALYTVELTMNHQMRLQGLVVDNGYEARLWLDTGSIFHIIIQPALEKFSREHPWLLGV